MNYFCDWFLFCIVEFAKYIQSYLWGWYLKLACLFLIFHWCALFLFLTFFYTNWVSKHFHFKLHLNGFYFVQAPIKWLPLVFLCWSGISDFLSFNNWNPLFSHVASNFFTVVVPSYIPFLSWSFLHTWFWFLLSLSFSFWFFCLLLCFILHRKGFGRL